MPAKRKPKPVSESTTATATATTEKSHLKRVRTDTNTNTGAGAGASARAVSVFHLPDVFVASAMRFGWFPPILLRDLIQLIALCACRFEVCGSGETGFADGAYDTAQFRYPTGVCFSIDVRAGAGAGAGAANSRVLLCADSGNSLIRSLNLNDGRASTFAGSGEKAFANGSCQSAAFEYLTAICIDPLNPGCCFIGDSGSIRYCDGETVSLIAGRDSKAEHATGEARFLYVNGLICTSNGKTLFVCDSGDFRLKSIDLHQTKPHRTVTTICGNDRSENIDVL